MAGDWFKTYRKIIDSQAFSHESTLRIWIYLLALSLIHI